MRAACVRNLLPVCWYRHPSTLTVNSVTTFSEIDNMPRRKQMPRKKWKFQPPRKGGKGYDEIKRANAAFESYYKAQGIVPEGEWDEFMEKLKINLPATFRITGFRRHAKQLLGFLKSHYFNELVDVKIDGLNVAKPYPLPWYPDELAWQLNVSRGNIRKIPALEKLHSFLVTETESGNISRQESVSMIPPLLLDVEPHHKIFDMCAAPGSKTAQLIEMLHTDETQAWPDGFIIANDSDNKRCYIMVHQTKRLNSPCFMIVNHDATHMPVIRIPDEQTGQLKQLKFDRVMCDVPCSADGTLRKNYMVWKKWSVHNGFSLHPVQLRLLTRGVEVLEVGGRLVYSTCSFNPVENEAVVASLLSRSQGALELVDCSQKLPHLKRINGLKTWKILNENGKEYLSYADVPERNQKRLRESMFPPKDVDTLCLDRCMRLLPHHQDTGGFFIAVLQKVKPLPWMNELKEKHLGESQTSGSADATDDGNVEASGPPPLKRGRFDGYKEDPFVFFKEDEEIWPSISEFYKVLPAFPKTQLLTRCETGKKSNVYLVNKATKDAIINNVDKLKVINSGVRVMARSDSADVACPFRLGQEGSTVLMPFLRNRIVDLTKKDVITLLTEENPFIHKLSDGARAQINDYGQGSLMFVYEPDESSPDDNRIIVVGWRGKTSVRSFVSKGDRHHILRMCGVNITSTKRPREEPQQRGGPNKTEDDSYEEDENEDEDMKDGVDEREMDIGDKDEGVGDKMEEGGANEEDCDKNEESGEKDSGTNENKTESKNDTEKNIEGGEIKDCSDKNEETGENKSDKEDEGEGCIGKDEVEQDDKVNVEKL